MSRQQPLVSVIVPAYNSKLFIGETLASVQSQTYEHLEVLIVDDGSTDDQKDVILPFCQNDGRFKYFFQTNEGVSAARNRGFRESKGEYLAFLDADDVWLPENLELKMKKFEQGDFGLVHGDAWLIDGQSDIIPGKLSGKEGKVLNDLLAWKETIVPGPSSIVIRRHIFEQAGMFDPLLSTSADQDLFIRVAALASIGRIPETTFHYRLHGSNMHKNIAQMEKDVLYVFNKARANNLFFSESFQRKCFANMYLILAFSWAGDGKNFKRGVTFASKAIREYPYIVFRMVAKFFKWVF